MKDGAREGSKGKESDKKKEEKEKEEKRVRGKEEKREKEKEHNMEAVLALDSKRSSRRDAQDSESKKPPQKTSSLISISKALRPNGGHCDSPLKVEEKAAEKVAVRRTKTAFTLPKEDE